MPEMLDMAAPLTDSHAARGEGPPSAANRADLAPAGRRRCYPLSEKRLAANRANALRSTGPRTRRGKERARLNAVRHGLRAALPAGQTPEIARALGEDSREFRSFCSTFFEDLHPRNLAERQIVERAARAAWRLRKTEAMEVELIEQAVAERIGVDGLRSGSNSPAFAAAIADQLRASRGSPFLRLADYQSRVEGSFHRALRDLCRLRKEQTKRHGSAADGLGVLSTLTGLGHHAEQQAPRTNEPIGEPEPSLQQPKERKPVTTDSSHCAARADLVMRCPRFVARTRRRAQSPRGLSDILRTENAPRGPPALELRGQRENGMGRDVCRNVLVERRARLHHSAFRIRPSAGLRARLGFVIGRALGSGDAFGSDAPW
jgi:hypothetical protein